MLEIIKILLFVPTAFAADTTTASEPNGPTGILTYAIGQLPLWITAVIVLILTVLISLFVKSAVESRLAAKISEEHQEILIISGRVAFVSTALVGTTIALAIAGINITTVLAAVGFGVSLGLQDTISNFVAGVTLLATKPFGFGDWILINGQKGKVEEIRTRFTILKTYDGLRLVVPNATLFKSPVLSYTSNATRRLKVPAYCRYGVDISQVREICMNVVKSDPRIFIEPKPNIIIYSLDDSYITLQVRFWVDPKGPWRRIQSKVYMGIQSALEEAGLDAPYPVASISFEKDLESVAIKAKMLDPNEFTNMMNARMAEEESYTKRRNEMLKKEVKATEVIPPDQSGATFLKEINNQNPQ